VTAVGPVVQQWVVWIVCCDARGWGRGYALANRLQTAIFGDNSGICKTRIQQKQIAAAEFGTFLLKTAMAHMEVRNRDKKTGRGGHESSFSLTRQAQTNRYNRRTNALALGSV
jgi:hypothetical protein